MLYVLRTLFALKFQKHDLVVEKDLLSLHVSEWMPVCSSRSGFLIQSKNKEEGSISISGFSLDFSESPDLHTTFSVTIVALVVVVLCVCVCVCVYLVLPEVSQPCLQLQRNFRNLPVSFPVSMFCLAKEGVWEEMLGNRNCLKKLYFFWRYLDHLLGESF